MHLQWISLLGLIAFIGLAWALSTHRRLFPWRTVLWGLALQFAFALLILKTPWGATVFDLTGRAVRRLIEFSNEGCRFVFGPLASDASLQRVFPEQPLVFAVLVTGTIILVSSLSSLFYHWGVLQRVVRAVAWVMRKALRTSGSETLSAAANIFMGQTEAPLLIRPYVPRMTRSELQCMMVGGMATIAGGVAAVYAKLGADAGHANMAGHLLTASVLNAPAALLISKVLLPETEPSETAGAAPKDPPRTTVNSLDALCRGASEGMMLAINVMAMLIAFVAVVALANFVLTWPQAKLGVDSPVTLQNLLGWLNAPFAWLMGVPAQDCVKIGQILGERIVLNEFIGYLSLTSPQTVVSERAFTIATYALCGFANFASIAIQVGGIGSLAPERRADMARLGLRAMLGGVLATYLSACIAGILIDG
ncbi:MAG: Na+ dependent nucleoside transporter domain protein [Verrucomicrobiae bacterium]|nr:Na+ dependent nucleoside transporter domain protein [Verrucomicrobiae bacterium]MDW8309098.1 nucleoside transporter C-terminal domain-containing protein [Verrucomicrobiales bacterium]